MYKLLSGYYGPFFVCLTAGLPTAQPILKWLVKADYLWLKSYCSEKAIDNFTLLFIDKTSIPI